MTSTRNVMAKSDIFFKWSSYATNEKKWHLPKVWHVFLYRYESKFWKFLAGFRTYFIEEVLLPVWSKRFNRCLLRLVYRKLNNIFRLLDCFGNSKSCLRDGFVPGTTSFADHFAFILKSAEYVKFWVTWNYGNISVGIGETFYHGQIMQNNFHNVYDMNNVLIKSFNIANWIVYL